jgi:hypothetical protein
MSKSTDLLNLKSKINKAIVQIITDNFIQYWDTFDVETMESEIYPIEEIDVNIKENEREIRECIDEYIKEFGVNTNERIHTQWLEDYIGEYFKG